MRCYSTDGGPDEYDGDGKDVEDDAARIFTIILCLTTLHRLFSHRYVHVWGTSIPSTPDFSQHLPKGLIVHYICHDF